MKAFEKWFENRGFNSDEVSHSDHVCNYGRRQGWEAALEHFNKMFLDGVHPSDVISAMQMELEDEWI